MAASFNMEIWLQGVLTWHNVNWKKNVLSGCTTAGIYIIQLFTVCDHVRLTKSRSECS